MGNAEGTRTSEERIRTESSSSELASQPSESLGARHTVVEPTSPAEEVVSIAAADSSSRTPGLGEVPAVPATVITEVVTRQPQSLSPVVRPRSSGRPTSHHHPGMRESLRYNGAQRGARSSFRYTYVPVRVARLGLCHFIFYFVHCRPNQDFQTIVA